MQNIFGLVCIEAYKLTGKDKFKNRAKELMRNFAQEFERLKDGSLVWYYWPEEFRAGWTAETRNSMHTPEREASSEEFYEDVSHAAWNLLFILEYMASFPSDTVIEDSVLTALRITLCNALKGHYARFLGSPEMASLKYFPGFSWGMIADAEWRQDAADSFPAMFIYNDFDNSYGLGLLYACKKISAPLGRISCFGFDGTPRDAIFVSTYADVLDFIVKY